MDRLTGFFTGLDAFRFSSGGNFVDRIHYKYTPMVLGAFSVTLMAIQFIGDYGIHCFCPAHFTDAMVDYTNRRCWTSYTYRVPMTSVHIPQEATGRMYISYYQWVVPILFVQCILLYLPSQIWRFFTNVSGYQISNLVAKAQKYNTTIKADKKEEILVDITDRLIARKRIRSIFPKRFMRVVDDYWLCVTYIITKLLYVLDVVWLMHFISWVLGDQPFSVSHSFVVEVLRQLHHTGEWVESPYFPLVTLCDFKVRTLNQVQPHTIQCTLPLNFYHERMFVVLWVWFAVLFFINLVSLLYWLTWVIFVLVARRSCHSDDDDDDSESNNNADFIRNTLSGPNTFEKPDITKPLLGAYDKEIGGNVTKKKMLQKYDNPNMIFIYEILKSNVGPFTAKAFGEAMVVRINRMQAAATGVAGNHLSNDRKPSAPALEKEENLSN